MNQSQEVASKRILDVFEAVLAQGVRRDASEGTTIGGVKAEIRDPAGMLVLAAHPDPDPQNKVREIIERVYADGLRRDSASGASDLEIDRFAQAQGVREVPSAVRELLHQVGAQPGMWLHPMEFGVRTIDSKTKQAVVTALLRMESSMIDPRGLLVLAAYPGSTYYVIDGSDLGEDDPPVWEVGLSEGSRRVRKSWVSTTGWLETMAPRFLSCGERPAGSKSKGVRVQTGPTTSASDVRADQRQPQQTRMLC